MIHTRLLKQAAIAAISLLAYQAPAYASEDQIELKPGVGRELVMANCVMCHSLDMIQINSPFMKQEKWEEVVGKMRKVMGAPIREEDVPVIVKYLTQNYGVE